MFICSATAGRLQRSRAERAESISLKFPSYITPKMENTLEIPEGVTVTVDLAGKPVSADTGASDIKIINHGTLTLIDSGTDGTLSIPIENDGVLNANGGTVTGKVTNRGTIQATGTPVTKFTGTLVNQEGASVTAGDSGVARSRTMAERSAAVRFWISRSLSPNSRCWF